MPPPSHGQANPELTKYLDNRFHGILAYRTSRDSTPDSDASQITDEPVVHDATVLKTDTAKAFASSSVTGTSPRGDTDAEAGKFSASADKIKSPRAEKKRVLRHRTRPLSEFQLKAYAAMCSMTEHEFIAKSLRRNPKKKFPRNIRSRFNAANTKSRAFRLFKHLYKTAAEADVDEVRYFIYIIAFSNDYPDGKKENFIKRINQYLAAMMPNIEGAFDHEDALTGNVNWVGRRLLTVEETAKKSGITSDSWKARV